jgi:hypothetical protein
MLTIAGSRRLPQAGITPARAAAMVRLTEALSPP